MRWFLCIFLCLTLNFSHAHEVNKAFFEIIEKESTIEITAEFPWYLRNALLTFAPELSSIKSQKEYDKKLKEYFVKNLILIGVDGKMLHLKYITNTDNNGHSHQVNYTLHYEGGTISKITNTLLFNVNDNQTNSHKINKMFFITSNQKTSFNLNIKKQTNYWWVYYLFSACLLFFYIRKYIKDNK